MSNIETGRGVMADKAARGSVAIQAAAQAQATPPPTEEAAPVALEDSTAPTIADDVLKLQLLQSLGNLDAAAIAFDWVRNNVPPPPAAPAP